LAKTYVDEIVGGDGKRKYKFINDSGVEIQKDYTPAQEGTYFGAEDATDFASRITANENSISTRLATYNSNNHI